MPQKPNDNILSPAVSPVASPAPGETVRFSVSETFAGARLDKVLSESFPELSRTRLQQIASEKGITVNGKPAMKSKKLSLGDIVAFSLPELVQLNNEPEDIALDIVYEDNHLIVVNKPKGMVVHPAPGHTGGTLVNALLSHCGDSLSGINGVMRPGIVHRIDKDTSGLLIVAKTDDAHKKLAAQIKEHSFFREYEAVAYGRFKENSFTVDAPIGRNPNDRKKMCVIPVNSKNAVTDVTVLEELNGFSYIKCRLHTGRTHQIRVHLSYIGHPIAGDTVYGPRKSQIDTAGQCLHARRIGFVHPFSGEYMQFSSELPEYFLSLLDKLRIKE